MRPLPPAAVVVTRTRRRAASAPRPGCVRPRFGGPSHLALDGGSDGLSRVTGDCGRSGKTRGPVGRRRLRSVADDRRDGGDRRRTRLASLLGEGSLVLGHRREDRQTGRGRQGSCRRIRRHDRQPLVVLHRVARQQSEVDARGGHARAVRQDDGEAVLLRGPDARRGRGDLVVDFEVDATGRPSDQTFIARRTRRRAASSGSSDVWSSMAW